ncbi:hypothetical protein ACFFUT_07275 [Pseudohalocynthiibacter aestuariivivens]|jgi:hypothetical protein|uniref:Uncharacterized protein n=1 Tax=Pseudohalocynthiibacter aestuariivivens TaxID=1591409 RepID=A0ABV5JDR6_9RHOB|nr:MULTISPECIES: hypothetical protein [Pseudohalocynthiibacter]
MLKEAKPRDGIMILDVARWVGAVKHDAEGSYMQLPEHLGVAFRR